MLNWTEQTTPVRVALASTAWEWGWGIFNRRNGEFSTGLDNWGTARLYKASCDGKSKPRVIY